MRPCLELSGESTKTLRVSYLWQDPHQVLQGKHEALLGVVRGKDKQLIHGDGTHMLLLELGAGMGQDRPPELAHQEI